MVHMIAGRAGSGKSRRMYEMAEAAMEAGKRVYLIVPDQATFQTEWEMAKRRPQGGMAGSGVLSFSRLCSLYEILPVLYNNLFYPHCYLLK